MEYNNNAARLITERRTQSPVAANPMIDNSMIGELHMITQKELKETLHYNPETGVFIWLKTPRGKVKAGDVAGHKDSDGYIIIKIAGKEYKAHRLAWLYVHGAMPEKIMDHINHVKADNRIINLRCVSHIENQKNRSLWRKSKTGITGVLRDSRSKMWLARITVDKKLIYLGVFDCFFSACCVRKSAENKYGFHANHGR